MTEDNDSEFVSRIAALLDFYSDRAVAHASFFVASVFGLVTFLTIVQQLEMGNSILYWASIFGFFGFSYLGFFTLTRFRYYAVVAEELTKGGLRRDETLKKIKVHLRDENRDGDLTEFMKKEDEKQKELLFPKIPLTRWWRLNRPILGSLYWVSALYLGFIVYSKFWTTFDDGMYWFAFLGLLILGVLLPMLIKRLLFWVRKAHTSTEGTGTYVCS